MQDKQMPLGQAKIGFLFILLILVYFVFLLTTAIAFRDIISFKLGTLALKEPMGIVLFPCMFVVGDIITELYGVQLARCVAIAALAADVLFSLIAYVYAHFSQDANYVAVLQPLLYISIISSISLVFTAIINVNLVSYLYTKYNVVFFGTRSFLASSTGEIILSSLALPHLLGVNYSNVVLKTSVILVIYKIVMSGILAPIGALFISIVKRSERFLELVRQES